MVYAPKKGDYVSWKEGTKPDQETRYGKVKKVTSSEYEVETYSPKDEEADGIRKKAKSEFADMQKSNWAKMKFQGKPNMIEVAENAVVASAYHTLLKKNALFGVENMSFLLADSIHEFLTKGLAVKIADMFEPYELTKDSGDIFQTADIWDSLQKVPFVTGMQQIIQHFGFRRPLNHQIMSNIFGNTGIFYLSNIGDRMWYADDNDTPAYRYK
jgi:hypothetical protein